MAIALVVAAYTALLLVVVFVYFRAKHKVGEAGTDRTDRVDAELVTGLMSELRKAEAETAYWRSAAERLQREADER